MKKTWLLKVLGICLCICVSIFLFTTHSNGQLSYNPYGYQQSYNPYGYQQPYFDGYQQPFSPYGYQQPYNGYGGGYPSISPTWPPIGMAYNPLSGSFYIPGQDNYGEYPWGY